MIALALFSLLPLLSEPASPSSVQDEKNSWTVYADMVYTANGDLIEGGLVTIRDGKIASVTKGRRPGGDALSVRTGHVVVPLAGDRSHGPDRRGSTRGRRNLCGEVR